jgi:hypothetical protein
VELGPSAEASRALADVDTILRDASRSITKRVHAFYVDICSETRRTLSEISRHTRLSDLQQNALSETVCRAQRQLSQTKSKKLNTLSNNLFGTPPLLPSMNFAQQPSDSSGVFQCPDVDPDADPALGSPVPVHREHPLPALSPTNSTQLFPSVPRPQSVPPAIATLAHEERPRYMNLSSRTVTASEHSILSKGLTFCPTNLYIDKLQLLKDVRRFHRTLRLRELHGGPPFDDPSQAAQLKRLIKSRKANAGVPAGQDPAVTAFIRALNNDIRSELRIAQKKHKRSKNVSRQEKLALKSLAQDNSIVIKPADKGGLIVILDSSQYLEKCNSLLRDHTVYKSICASEYDDILRTLRQELGSLTTELGADLVSFLSPEDTRPGRFYGLPKIHKPNVPMRPIVSANGTATENIAILLDLLTRELPSTTPSFIKDTNHFLETLSSTPFPTDSEPLLVTLDCQSLYTNIPHDEGIAATVGLYTKHFERENSRYVIKPGVVDRLLRLVLRNNVFEFNDSLYLQLTGTSMGAVMAPNYANLFLHKLEVDFIETFYQRTGAKPYLYVRFIDDIFMIWTAGEALLHQFITELNEVHVSMKFTHTVSSSDISFLDVRVSIGNGVFTTSIYRKPTDNPSYLHFSSEHPRHMKVSIPYSQSLRCRRICSDTAEAEREIELLLNRFRFRGYPTALLNDAKRKALAYNRNTTSSISRQKSDNLNLITTYSSYMPKLNRLLQKHYPILQSNPSTKSLFPTPPRAVYRRSKNLRDILVRAKFNSRNSTVDPGVLHPGCKPCKKDRRCLACKQMMTTTQVNSTANNFTFQIRGDYDCQTSDAVYLLECSACQAQYIGETCTKFNYRLNGHRSDCSRKPHLPVSRHVSQLSHPFSDFKCAILRAGFKNDQDRADFESYMIQMFNSKEKGLNADFGSLPPLF